MRKLFVLSFVLVVLLITGCNNSNPVNNSSENIGVVLDQAYDSLKLVSPTLKDARNNPELNTDITVTDIPGIGDQGRTIIKFKGVEIFNNTWDYPMYVNNRMKTVVKHGVSSDNKYFLYIYNESTSPSGTGWSEYKIYTIDGSGNLKELTRLFKNYIFGLQEYSNGSYLVRSTNRGPGPGGDGTMYISLMDKAGNVTHYNLP